MNLSQNIREIRKAKGLSQKEVVLSAGLDAGQYSRIESGKTDPSISTLEKIAKAIGVKTAELFIEKDDNLTEVKSYDKTLMEKVNLLETLNEEEKKTIFMILDTFVSRNKLKTTLSNAINQL